MQSSLVRILWPARSGKARASLEVDAEVHATERLALGRELERLTPELASEAAAAVFRLDTRNRV
jgi:hypothetical protein